MGFLFTPIAFLPNTPTHASDMNSNFSAIAASNKFWGEWYYDQGDNKIGNVRVLSLEDYTTQDDRYAPNGLQFIRLRPSFDSMHNDLSLAFSSINSTTGNVYDAVYAEVSFRTFIRFGLKHGPSGKTYATFSQGFTATGNGTFNFSYADTPVRAKLNYGGNSVGTASAQTIGYSALGSSTITVAVSSSAKPWTGQVMNV